MSHNETHDLYMVKELLEHFAEEEIIIIASTLESAKFNWRIIKRHTGTNRKPHIITNHPSSIDGLPFRNSVILKIGNWWENEHAPYVIEQGKLAKHKLAITHL